MSDKIEQPADDEAERLYRQLKEGIDDPHSSPASSAEKQYSTKELDQWRLLLIELAHLLSTYFTDVHLLEGIKTRKDSFEELVTLFSKLSRIPEQEGTVLIRYRGFTSSESTSGKTDYVMGIGNIIVDTGIATSIVKRLGIRMSHIAKRLIKAFEIFSAHGINTFFLNIPDLKAPDSEIAVQRMRLSLAIFARYNQAFKMNEPIIFNKRGKKITLPIILDERQQPDPNLTLLAGLNDLSPDETRDMVRRVDEWLKNSGLAGERYASVYDAIFDIKSLRNKLKRPPIEVNNIKWQMIGRGQKIVSQTRDEVDADNDFLRTQEPKKAQPEKQPSELEIEEPRDFTEALPESHEEMNNYSEESGGVQQLLEKYFGKSSPQPAKIHQTVYASDYKRITSQQLGSRILMVEKFLDIAKEYPNTDKEQKEVLYQIADRFEYVQDKTWGNLAIHEGSVKIRAAGKQADLGKLDPRLLKIISTAKARVSIKRKMENIVQGNVDFTDRDYAALAQEFSIKPTDAKEIVSLLQNCFDENGGFLRKNFDRNIPQFAKYEDKIFGFLWHYLKESMQRRQDRISFLNALQLLISEMKQPKKGIRILMTDFLANPTIVTFSDRNAIMLSNLLVRKYNKELNLDIELTPEEVLLVREGVEREIAAAVAKVIDSTKIRFLRKVSTIQRQIRESLSPAKGGESTALPFRYVLSLERELFIFLSLVEGKTALSILRNAIRTYGDSGSQIYNLPRSREEFVTLLQHLKVLLRGLGRIGDDNDLAILDGVSWSEQGFLRLARGSHEKEKVQQVMRWVDLTKESIIRKTMKDSRDTDGFTVS